MILIWFCRRPLGLDVRGRGGCGDRSRHRDPLVYGCAHAGRLMLGSGTVVQGRRRVYRGLARLAIHAARRRGSTGGSP